MDPPTPTHTHTHTHTPIPTPTHTHTHTPTHTQDDILPTVHFTKHPAALLKEVGQSLWQLLPGLELNIIYTLCFCIIIPHSLCCPQVIIYWLRSTCFANSWLGNSLTWLHVCCGEFPHFTYKLRPSLALEQQRTNLRLKMAESTTLNAASSPQLMEGLTKDERVWYSHDRYLLNDQCIFLVPRCTCWPPINTLGIIHSSQYSAYTLPCQCEVFYLILLFSPHVPLSLDG